jgi:glycosyltransferase involved in cell wall biosynthesis
MQSKILIITQHFPPDNSGNASRIYDLSRNLVKLGSEVTVISPYPTFPHGSFKKIWKRYSYSEIDGIKHYKIFAWQPNYENPSFMSRMAYYITFPLHALWFAFLKRKEYDVIINSSPPIFTGLTGFVIKKITRKIWFCDIRDLWIDTSVGLGFLKDKSIFEKISRKYESVCYHNCDMISVTTEEIKKTIADTYNISIEKIIILSNGVDTKLFRPSSIKKNRLIYVGNIGHAQDLEKIILAVKKVNESHPFEFYLIGDGDIKNKLKKLVKKEGLENIIIFTGQLDREKIPTEIAESLIGVAPLKNIACLSYAIPTKVYEYMSCSIPFLATGKGEIEDLIKVSQAGEIAENDINSITQKLINMIENKKMIIGMGNKGREFVEKYYDRTKIAKYLLQNIENEFSNE